MGRRLCSAISAKKHITAALKSIICVSVNAARVAVGACASCYQSPRTTSQGQRWHSPGVYQSALEDKAGSDVKWCDSCPASSVWGQIRGPESSFLLFFFCSFVFLYFSIRIPRALSQCPDLYDVHAALAAVHLPQPQQHLSGSSEEGVQRRESARTMGCWMPGCLRCVAVTVWPV